MDPNDMRKFRRHTHTGDVLVGFPDGGNPEIGGLINLSLGGCMVRLLGKQRFASGTRIELWIRSKTLTFRSLGIVRRRVVQAEMPTLLGVEFVDLSKRGHAHLARLIAELEFEPARPGSREWANP